MSVPEVKQQAELTIGQSPRNFEHDQSRWTLRALRQTLNMCSTYTLPGLRSVLLYLGIRYLRARQYVHSPDEHYAAKVQYLQSLLERCDPANEVIYFLDQLTVYLHPSVGYDYAADRQQPLARQGYSSNTTWRICGALNALTGEVHTMMRNKISIASLVAFFRELSEKHPNKTIFVILDNWTVHWHPDVRAALQTQHYPFEGKIPASWQQLKPRKKFLDMNLPVQLVYLPTYASWLNPIEKLWRWLKQDVIHNHRCTDESTTLKEHVQKWLEQAEHTGANLIRYVGLQNKSSIFYKPLLIAKANNFKERFIF